MNVSLYQAAAAMNANARWQEMISDNLASSSIPGARKRDITFSAVEAGLSANQQGAVNGRFVVPSANSSVNFQPGTLRSTGAPMDLAIEGKGFFEVQLPNGSTAYTRDGEFHLNAQSQLVTKQGYNVLGDSGPVQLDPNNGSAVTISPTGDISQGSEIKGKLHVVEFVDPSKLSVTGQGYFSAEQSGVQPLTTGTSLIHQGFLENSNTSPTSEMANLINAMRMFEANQRVLQMQDERIGRTISELGSPS